MAKRVVQGRSASSLFLIELIVAIGFFAVASAVCLQLFVRARLVSIESADLSRATLAAQSAAEAYRGCDGDIKALAILLGEEEQDGSLLLRYDAEWRPSAQQGAAYQLAVTGGGGRPLSADILVERTGDSAALFRLTVKTPGGDTAANTREDAP